ncbi:hypothetical protein FACS1894191_3030 [Clostridia bacterium]|nr:hypothetical protein FACS1894191_3030 [Clostridia bacterium]
MNTENSNLGMIVKAARMRKGLTQEALAEKSRVSPRHVSGMENEGNYPSFEALYRLIRELNIPADEIFYPERQNTNAPLEYLKGLLGKCGERDILAITALVEALLKKS